MGFDRRVVQLAESLIEWQWPDGGWNCDRHPAVEHSSFYETVTPMWGLAEYARATGSEPATEASRRAADFLLSHHVYRSHRAGDVGDARWLELRYPEYWHYDVLHGLVMLSRAGALPDPRAEDAFDVVRGMQHADGRWYTSGSPYYRRSGDTYLDPANWDRESASAMLTLNALRVLGTGA
jgi:hypothetical protein